MGQRAHPLLDMAARTIGQGEQQRIGLACPAGEVEDADGVSCDRITYRSRGAGEPAQRPDVVLVAANERGLPSLQCGADSVGAHELFGVAVARRELHRVERIHDGRVGGHPL